MPGVMRRTTVVGILLLGLALAACGAGTDQAMPVVTGARAQRLVAASAVKAEAEKTAKVSGRVSVEAGGRRASIPLDGAIDFRTNAVQFSMDFGRLVGTSGTTIEMRVVDGVAYMSLGSLPEAARGFFEDRMDGKHWIKVDPASLGVAPDTGSSALGGDAGSTVGSLRGVDDVTRIGTEDVGGVPTTHYHGVIDVEKALAKLPARLRDQMRATPGLGQADMAVDVWVDADGLPRQMAVDVDTATMRLTEEFEFSDFGEPVDLTAPPADDVVDFTEVFGGLLGGASGLPTT
jgi:hypothetical protein